MILSLRLNSNGPRRVAFRKVSPPFIMVYGQTYIVDREKVADLNKSEALFRNLAERGKISMIEGDDEKSVKTKHVGLLREELDKPSGMNQSWRGIERDPDTNLPTINVGLFSEDTRDVDGDNSQAAAAQKKSAKESAFAANKRKQKAAEAA